MDADSIYRRRPVSILKVFDKYVIIMTSFDEKKVSHTIFPGVLVMRMKRIYVSFGLSLLILCVFSLVSMIMAQPNNDEESARGNEKAVNYCIECHKTLSGKTGSVLLEWRESVHADNNRECQICHGGNPRVNDSRLAKSKKYNFIGKPSKREVLSFCGRRECHATAYRQFQRSPHYTSVMQEGEPNCVSCHGKHNIQRSTLHIISDRTCSDCHSVEYSRQMVVAISDIEKNIEDIEESFEYLDKRHIEKGETEKRYRELKSYFHQLVHVFSKQEIEYTRKFVELEIEYLENDLKSKITVVRRLDLIYLLTAFISVFIIISFAVYVLHVTRKRRNVK